MENFAGAHRAHHGTIEKIVRRFFRGDGWLFAWAIAILLMIIVCKIAGIEGPH